MKINLLLFNYPWGTLYTPCPVCVYTVYSLYTRYLYYRYIMLFNIRRLRIPEPAETRAPREIW